MSKLLSKNGSSIASPRTSVIFRKISFFSLCLSGREHRGRHIQTDHVPGQRRKRTSASADSGGNLQHRIRRLRFDPRCGIVYLC